MTTSLAEVQALADRCRKLGWTVTRSQAAGGGWRVKCPDGAVVVLHSSYSDRNSVRAVTRDLNGHGLADAEAAVVAARKAENAQRLTAERKAADAKGEQLARQSQLSTRAAGPYAGPESVPLDWFLAEHPAPWMRWVIITPAIAAELLTRNTDNRPLRRRIVDDYKRVIEAKQWHLTHQGMATDTRGVLQDGQHRLMACAETDTPITAAFFVGMPPENFKFIDEGRKRTAADLLGKDGEVDTSMLSTVVRLIAAYREPYPRAFLRQRTSNQSLYDAFKGDPDALRDAVNYGRHHFGAAKLACSALSAVRYLLVDIHGAGNSYVEAFLRGLITGTKGDSRVLLDADDPRLQLRDQLNIRRQRGNRTMALDQLGLMIWAWNNVASGRRARHVKWAEFQNDDIPPITVCRDKGRGASSTPALLHGEIEVPQ